MIRTLDNLDFEVANETMRLNSDVFYFDLRGFSARVFPHIVTRREEGRPDLLAARLMGSDGSDFPSLLRFNGILNPFSIREGSIVFYARPDVLRRLDRAGRTVDPEITAGSAAIIGERLRGITNRALPSNSSAASASASGVTIGPDNVIRLGQ